MRVGYDDHRRAFGNGIEMNEDNKISRHGRKKQVIKDDTIIGRKSDHVIAVACSIFLDYGFQHASMEAIANAASVSKATLYSYFPSKRALFTYIITEECRRIKDFIIMPSLDVGLEEALRSFSQQYIRLFVDREPKHLNSFRILVSEVSQFPELGQLMIDSGPKAHAEHLAKLLEAAHGRGMLCLADAGVAATQFLSLVRGELPIQSALGLAPPTDAEIDQTIEQGLALFLKVYRHPASAAKAVT